MSVDNDNMAQLKELSPKEQTFADHYLIALNKTASAIEAGCPSGPAARVQGFEIYNRPHVRTYIEAKLKERTITAEETIKLISDTAIASVTDYFVPVMVERVPRIEVPLAQVIADREEYVSREMEFLDCVGYTEAKYDDFVGRLDTVRHEIVRLRIELNRNPSSTCIIDGPPQLVEEMQLDINALVADKERGKVKKIKVLKDGAMEIEMYSAQDAQEKLMRMHGKYAKDNEQSKPVFEAPLTDANVDKIIAALTKPTNAPDAT
jgi:phage terminase small subunit